MSPQQTGKYTTGEKIEITGVYGDLSQEIIKTTSDRLSLILHLHLQSIQRKREWFAPAGILATLLVVFPTTTFKDRILPWQTWQAMFVSTTALVVAWLGRALFRALKSKSVNDLLEIIKQKR